MAITLEHGLFIAPYQDVTESPTVGLSRDLDPCDRLECEREKGAAAAFAAWEAKTGRKPG